MNNNQSYDESGYLFNVDIMVKSRSNALALQAMIQMLNENESIVDYRINSGVELGHLIESMLQDKRNSHNNKPDKPNATVIVPLPERQHKQKTKNGQQAKSPSSPAETKKTTKEYSSQLYGWITDCIRDNRLTRLTTNRSGQPTSMPCRILNFDETNQLLNVYHVDEKQVYSFKLSEIIEVV